VPPQLLTAIGLVESGRLDPAHHTLAPWPWSVDADGVGHYYASKQAAIAATTALEAAGSKSIDVGCMQINLQQHRSVFASLDEAFDPMANTKYAARFLESLYRQTGSWPKAAAAYHSQTPGIGEAYREDVMARWPLASRYGGDIATAPATEKVDPYHVLTASFRAQLQGDALFRARRNAAMLIPAHAAPRPKKSRTARIASAERDVER
jgi:hypothetical protein